MILLLFVGLKTNDSLCCVAAKWARTDVTCKPHLELPPNVIIYNRVEIVSDKLVTRQIAGIFYSLSSANGSR